jgi:1-acyl-sn-glycerol-3-phosphate acyltransferase
MKRLYFIPPFILQSLVWVPTQIILSVFTNFKVTGIENIKNLKGPLIFAPNHSSEWDPILVPAALTMFNRFIPIFYTAAEDKAFKNSVTFGWRAHIYGGKFFNVWGAYPVYSGHRDYAFALSNHVQILQDGGSLCIFPEGYLSRDGNIGKAHGGVGYLSHRTGIPIVPVTISGVFKSNTKGFLRQKYQFKLNFGKPIPFPKKWTVELSPEDYKAQGELVLGIIRDNLDNLTLSTK